MTIIIDNFEKKCGLCKKTDKQYNWSWKLRLWLCNKCHRKQEK